MEEEPNSLKSAATNTTIRTAFVQYSSHESLQTPGPTQTVALSRVGHVTPPRPAGGWGAQRLRFRCHSDPGFHWRFGNQNPGRSVDSHRTGGRSLRLQCGTHHGNLDQRSLSGHLASGCQPWQRPLLPSLSLIHI